MNDCAPGARNPVQKNRGQGSGVSCQWSVVSGQFSDSGSTGARKRSLLSTGAGPALRPADEDLSAGAPGSGAHNGQGKNAVQRAGFASPEAPAPLGSWAEGRLLGPILLDRGFFLPIEVRSLPGPQVRGTGGTLIVVWKGHRDRGHPPPSSWSGKGTGTGASRPNHPIHNSPFMGAALAMPS